MSKKHTPGPWVAKMYITDPDRPTWGVRNFMFAICNMVEQDMENAESGEERANAELIASAPDLLAENDDLKERVQVLKFELKGSRAETSILSKRYKKLENLCRRILEQTNIEDGCNMQIEFFLRDEIESAIKACQKSDPLEAAIIAESHEEASMGHECQESEE